jgi:cytochrome b561
MMRNSTTKWGWPAKTMHWIGAAIILVLLVHGWWMTHMTPRPDRLSNYAAFCAWLRSVGVDRSAAFVAIPQSSADAAC